MQDASVPSVVAIVLNWCNEDLTAACLRSVEMSTYPNLDILVVDNGSPDGSGDRLRARFPSCAYLQTGSNLGYAGGNNRGIELCLRSNPDYVLVLNNDMVEKLIMTMLETNYTVRGKIRDYFIDPTIENLE